MRARPYHQRSSGIPSVGDLPWGSHFCVLHSSERELLQALVLFLQAGLESNELCSWEVGALITVEEATRALNGTVPDLGRYLALGQIEIFPAAEAPAGKEALDRRLDTAILAGFEGLRLVRNAGSGERASSTDAEAVRGLHAITAFVHPRAEAGAIDLMQVLQDHRFALVCNSGRWEVLEGSAVRTVRDELARSEEKLRSVFRNMSEGFAYHRIIRDAGGEPCDYVFLEVNSAFERLTGLVGQEIVGKRVTQVLPGIERDPTDWIGRYGRVALTGEPVQFESHSASIDRWYAVSAFSPHRGYFAVTFADITARKGAEEERRLAEERLRVTLRSVGDAVIATDTEARVTLMNRVAEGLTGWKEAEARGRPLAEVFHIVDEDTGAAAEAPVPRAIAEGSVVGLANHTALIARDGRRIAIADSAAPVHADGGGLLGVVLVFRDVSEARQAERERDLTIEFLRFVNESTRTADLVQAAATFFQRESGCEAVGIQLAEGDDFPYHEARSSPEESLRAENGLCERDAAGELRRDGAGDSLLACGEVISGRPDPSRPLTQSARLWSNSVSGLPGADEAHREPRCGLCHAAGYQSMALLPLRVGNEQLGLLQLADRRQGILSADSVALWERLAGYLAVAVARSRAEAALQDLKRQLEVRVQERTRDLGRAMASLTAERRRLFDVLETLPAMICLLTPDHRVPFANRAFREKFGEAEGRRCYEYCFGRSEPCEFCESFEVLETGKPHRWEVTIPGSGRIIDAHDFPFTDVDGSPLILEMDVDVTEHKRAEAALRELNETLERRVEERTAALEEEVAERRRAELALKHANLRLEEADRRKNDFLAVLSHELRNPLAPISNSLWVLERAKQGEAGARRAKEVIDRQVGHLSRLVDDLLDVTRISRNKIQLHRDRMDLCEVVRRSVEDQHSLFESRKVLLESDLPPRPIFVNADATRVAQMVGNLLQNAAKFTNRGGTTRVLVASDRPRGQAMVRVVDDGVGMAAETLESLFHPFMQADVSLDRSRGGLGLGLALVKGLVELHGGEVSARSEGLGKGAEFEVRLPLSDLAAAVTRAGQFVSPRRRVRVLIIEDNVDAADSLRDALQLGEHEVAVAYEGREGIARAREMRPDVVLCDIGLPGMNGFEVARAFRAEEALRRTFLVALSGYALPDDLRRAQEAGFEQHLAKPVNMEVLEELFAALLLG